MATRLKIVEQLDLRLDAPKVPQFHTAKHLAGSMPLAFDAMS